MQQEEAAHELVGFRCQRTAVREANTPRSDAELQKEIVMQKISSINLHMLTLESLPNAKHCVHRRKQSKSKQTMNRKI